MIWPFWAFCFGCFGVIFLGVMLLPRTYLCGRGFCVNGSDSVGLFVAIGLGMFAGFGLFGMDAFPDHLSLPRALVGSTPVAAWCALADRRFALGWETKPSLRVTAIRATGSAAVFVALSWPLLTLLSVIWTMD